MRVWDVDPSQLCRQHLLGEHRELHGLWNILKRGGGGYWHHPETQRWVGYDGALWVRHEALVREMSSRGYNHKSPLVAIPAVAAPAPITPLAEQVERLRSKPCECYAEQGPTHNLNY